MQAAGTAADSREMSLLMIGCVAYAILCTVSYAYLRHCELTKLLDSSAWLQGQLAKLDQLRSKTKILFCQDTGEKKTRGYGCLSELPTYNVSIIASSRDQALDTCIQVCLFIKKLHLSWCCLQFGGAWRFSFVMLWWYLQWSPYSPRFSENPNLAYL